MCYELINEDTAEVLFVTEMEAMSIKDDRYARYENNCMSIFVSDVRFESVRKDIGGDFLMQYYYWFNK